MFDDLDLFGNVLVLISSHYDYFNKIVRKVAHMYFETSEVAEGETAQALSIALSKQNFSAISQHKAIPLHALSSNPPVHAYSNAVLVRFRHPPFLEF